MGLEEVDVGQRALHRQQLELEPQPNLCRLVEPEVRWPHRVGVEPGKRLHTDDFVVVDVDHGLEHHANDVASHRPLDLGVAKPRLLENRSLVGQVAVECRLELGRR